MSYVPQLEIGNDLHVEPFSRAEIYQSVLSFCEAIFEGRWIIVNIL